MSDDFKEWEPDQQLHPDEEGRVYIAGVCPYCKKSLKLSMYHRGSCCDNSDLLAACKMARDILNAGMYPLTVAKLDAAIAKAERKEP